MSIPSIYYGYLLEKIKEMLPSQSCIPSWKKAPQTRPTSVEMTNWMFKKYNAVIYFGRFRVMYKPSK